jgi:hypothetical protein
MKSIRREGFWYEGAKSSLPKPIALAKPWVGKDKFLRSLTNLEAEASRQRYKGSSKCRICKCRNGSTEFDFKGWVWPVGFGHYVKDHNVLPSLAFREFVLGKGELQCHSQINKRKHT